LPQPAALAQLHQTRKNLHRRRRHRHRQRASDAREREKVIAAAVRSVQLPALVDVHVEHWRHGGELLVGWKHDNIMSWLRARMAA
jgi:hypothetical protein